MLSDVAALSETDADRRAYKTEQQMTDEERFSLIISVIGGTSLTGVRDERIPEDIPMSAGYTPGVPRARGPGAVEQRRQHGCHEPRLPARR